MADAVGLLECTADALPEIVHFGAWAAYGWGLGLGFVLSQPGFLILNIRDPTTSGLCKGPVFTLLVSDCWAAATR